MEDRFVKYSRLYILLFLLFLTIPVILGTVFYAFYGFSKLVSSNLGDIIYSLGIITIPPALFSAVYVIYFRRTGKHPLKLVQVISRVLFVAGIVCSVAVLVLDIILFFKKRYIDIDGYYCFTLAYLAGNVAMIFLIGIMQAFTAEKEVDWMDRRH